MTYQNDFTLPAEIVEQIAANGMDYLPELIRTMINTAIPVWREKHLRTLRTRGAQRSTPAGGR